MLKFRFSTVEDMPRHDNYIVTWNVLNEVDIVALLPPVFPGTLGNFLLQSTSAPLHFFLNILGDSGETLDENRNLAETRHTVHGRGAKTPGIWNLHFFRKKFKKIVQILFKTLSVYHWGRNFDTFFSKLPKSVFQTLTVEQHVSTPHILLVKITKIRTN